jgi:Leucine rich repeat
VGISELPDNILHEMKSLQEIFLNGNQFISVPESLFAVGKSLEYLHLSDNPIAIIDANSFTGLEKLKQLNISSMPDLQSIESESFKHVILLELLHCRGNQKLHKFDMEDLRELKHLRELDVSNNALTSLEFGEITIENENQIESHSRSENHFKQLRLLKLAGNPWNCDCSLLNSLLLFDHNATYFSKSEKEDDARCKTPTSLASKFIYHLPFDHVCVTKGKQKIPIYDPPQFLRPKSIMLTVFSVIGVVVLGIFIGFGIVCIKQKLKRSEPGYSSSPIRYTTVRDSTISNVVNSPYSP